MIRHLNLRGHPAYLLLLALILPILAACGGATTGPAAPPTAPAAQPATAATQPTAAAPAAQPTAEQAAGGALKILYWQAPTILNPHQGQGTKNSDAAHVMLEPLAHWDQDGKPVAFLAAELPTIENGGVAKDGTSITWKLKQGVKWSDGSDFSADDVVFTWEYCADEATACTTKSNFDPIEKVEALDPATVKITWKEPNPNPYVSFVGVSGLVIQRKQYESCIGAVAAQCPANNSPIGTGPYKLQDFKPGDIVLYVKNENYRDAAKVAFASVEIKGGGDPVSAARAVCETGEVDYAWNLQIEAAVAEQILQGGKCDFITSGSTGIERIVVNFTNPDAALGDLRAEPGQPHPVLTDNKIRQALSLAIDRNAIAEQVYGVGGKPTCNILTQPTDLNSPNTTCDRDVEKAKQLLDEAGWTDTDGDNIRDKDGKPLQLLYATSINAVRQKVQAIVKQNWAEIGVGVELKSIDSGVFFSSDKGNPDTFGHFFSDVQMYTNNPDSPDPVNYFDSWTCAQVASKENGWNLANNGRYCNQDYDAVLVELSKTFDPAKRKELFIKANDMLIGDGAILPLVDRSTPEGKATALQGPTGSTFDSVLWNIATWHK